MENKPLHLTNYSNAGQGTKNYVPNFFHRGITAMVILLVLMIAVFAANAFSAAG